MLNLPPYHKKNHMPMGKYLKIKPLCCSKYNTGEYINFLRRCRYYLLLDAADSGNDVPGSLAVRAKAPMEIPYLGVAMSQVEELDSYIEQLADLNAQSRIFNETEKRNSLDEQRTDLASFVINRMQNSQRNTIENEMQAATQLLNLVKPYMKIPRLPNNQKTEAITGMITDLRKPENTDAVELLGLTSYVDKLEMLNEQYVSETHQMSQSRIKHASGSTKDIRKKCDSLLDDILTQAFAWSIVDASEKATNFIVNINNLITETNTAYNLRRGQGKKEEDGNNDAPGPITDGV